MKDSFSIKGRIKLVHLDKEGNVKSVTEKSNIITNAGIAEVTNLMGNVSSPVAFTYLAVGTSATAVAATDTTLGAEVTTDGLERVAATVTQETTTVTDDTLQLYHEWTATGTQVVEEVGVLNAASVGDLLGHALTTTKSLVSGDKLQITYKVTLS